MNNDKFDIHELVILEGSLKVATLFWSYNSPTRNFWRESWITAISGHFSLNAVTESPQPSWIRSLHFERSGIQQFRANTFHRFFPHSAKLCFRQSEVSK